MHTARLTHYLLLSLCCLCWRCKPTPVDTQQPQGRVRIKKVTVDLSFLRTIDNYSYNVDGQLVLVLKQTRERFTTPINHYPYYIDNEQRIVLSYDQQKRLVRMEGLPSDRRISFRYTYLYTNRNSQPTFILYAPTTTDSLFNSRQKTVYQVYYGADERPTKITSSPNYNDYGTTDEYTYANGNIVTIRQSSSYKYAEPHTTQYEFDDKPNPFYKLYVGVPTPGLIGFNRIKQLFFHQDNPFNPNNIIDPLAKDSYAYDSTGHITKTGRTTFEYETF